MNDLIEVLDVLPEPAGPRILVRVDTNLAVQNQLEEGWKCEKGEVRTRAGLIVAKADNGERLRNASDNGIVIKVSPTAYSDMESEWCSPGDRVFFRPYEGCAISGEKFGEDGVTYICINAESVWMVIRKELIN